MKFRTMSCVVLLAVCLLGCQSADTGTKPTEMKVIKRNPGMRPHLIDVDVTDLSGIIVSVCKSLDLTVKQTTKESGHYSWSCKSLGNLDVEIEAIALIKGKSLVRVDVGGGNWGSDLKRFIDGAIIDAAQNHQMN